MALANQDSKKIWADFPITPKKGKKLINLKHKNVYKKIEFEFDIKI